MMPMTDANKGHIIIMNDYISSTIRKRFQTFWSNFWLLASANEASPPPPRSLTTEATTVKFFD